MTIPEEKTKLTRSAKTAYLDYLCTRSKCARVKCEDCAYYSRESFEEAGLAWPTVNKGEETK